VFRKTGQEHYKTHEAGNNATAVRLLGMDEVFNPGAKPKVVNEQMVKHLNAVDDVLARAAKEVRDKTEHQRPQ
jgi:hypothetical protein